eukprot:4087958-Prymnesium_polylepis.1
MHRAAQAIAAAHSRTYGCRRALAAWLQRPNSSTNHALIAIELTNNALRIVSQGGGVTGGRFDLPSTLSATSSS